jgi:hypothetical protein
MERRIRRGISDQLATFAGGVVTEVRDLRRSTGVFFTVQVPVLVCRLTS